MLSSLNLGIREFGNLLALVVYSIGPSIFENNGQGIQESLVLPCS